MGRDPSRGSRPHPSPLSQVQSSTNLLGTRHSTPSSASLAASEARGDVTLVADPVFWTRFGKVAAVYEASVDSAGGKKGVRITLVQLEMRDVMDR